MRKPMRQREVRRSSRMRVRQMRLSAGANRRPVRFRYRVRGSRPVYERRGMRRGGNMFPHEQGDEKMRGRL